MVGSRTNLPLESARGEVAVGGMAGADGAEAGWD
jgi:hypothetical protein